MWQEVEKGLEEKLLKSAVEFTGNHCVYGEYMHKVLEKWKYSTEHNLSNHAINRQAWIGHAACYIAIGCPEYITRKAWSHLTDEQRDLANRQADIAILEFEKNYIERAIDE